MAADNLSIALTELGNIKVIVWIEMLTAAQGMDFRRPSKGGIGSELGYEKARSLVKYLDKDRIMYVDLRQYNKLLSDYAFIREINDIAESS